MISQKGMFTYVKDEILTRDMLDEGPVGKFLLVTEGTHVDEGAHVGIT